MNKKTNLIFNLIEDLTEKFEEGFEVFERLENEQEIEGASFIALNDKRELEESEVLQEAIKKFYLEIYTVTKFNKKNYMLVVSLQELITILLIYYNFLKIKNDNYYYYKMVSREISHYFIDMAYNARG